MGMTKPQSRLQGWLSPEIALLIVVLLLPAAMCAAPFVFLGLSACTTETQKTIPDLEGYRFEMTRTE
jgi:hypothetical protein